MSNDKNTNTNTPQDKGLQGNEKIEQAIAALQQEATQELLAYALTVIRRRMNENGQFILAVEPPTGDNQLRIGTVKTGDNKVWCCGKDGYGFCLCKGGLYTFQPGKKWEETEESLSGNKGGESCCLRQWME